MQSFCSLKKKDRQNSFYSPCLLVRLDVEISFVLILYNDFTSVLIITIDVYLIVEEVNLNFFSLGTKCSIHEKL